jgi:ABC-type polysaccharide/polyol phosphate transport system ATPase subunit
MEKEIAVKIEHVSKTFRIPHEKVSSVRGAVVSMFRQSTYEEFQALDDVSFEVKKGEFFGIIGRNGSGKSTLLKVLAGIYQPDAGKVAIDGMISPFLELGIGFNPELSGRDNVYLNATVLGMTKKEIDQKFNDIVAFSELERFIDQKLKNYSSGMQVRLAFAVSIHANRDILLMDEVLAVGDSNFQAKCFREFNHYHDMGRTVIIVTHDISVVQRYCDRAMLLREGKIDFIGTGEEASSKYIENNISDHEFLRETDLAGESSGGQEMSDKQVRITKVELIDENGVIREGMRSGQKINIRIHFKKEDMKVEDINFGIGLYKDDNSYVFGYNTQMDGYIPDLNSGILTLSLDALHLIQGIYFIRCVCFGEVEQEYYDFIDKAKIFQVFSKGVENQYRGVLRVDHSWN